MIAPAALETGTEPQSVGAAETASPGRSGELARRVGRTAREYGGAALLCLVLLTVLLRLWQVDLSVPLGYNGDSTLYQSLFKGALEHGWYLSNPNLGMPDGHALHDFPMADGLHFLAVKLLGLPFSDYAIPFNLYYLLTYLLTTWSGLFVLRRLGLTYPVALVAALLYAFLPYHFFRGTGHYCLSAYYLVPLMVLAAVRVGQGRGPFVAAAGDRGTEFPADQHDATPDGLETRPTNSRLAGAVRTLGFVVLCLAAGAGGIYYAAFGVFFLVVAGTVGSLQARRAAPLLSAGCCVGLIGLVLALQFVPTLLYRHEYGRNPAAVSRHSGEAEAYGLRITQLVLPMTLHRLPPLERWKARYYSSPHVQLTEADSSTLGVVGTIGFLCLLGGVFIRRPENEISPFTVMAWLNLAGLLLACVGGFGSVGSLCGVRWIRAYTRISVFLAFFALFATGRLLQSWRDRWEGRSHTRLAFLGLLAAVLLVGVWDQTCDAFVPPHAELQHAFREDAAYFGSLEESQPEGAMIFQMPYVSYVEHGPCGKMDHYEHLKPYLHSRWLRWSYGAIEGRPGAKWQRQVLALPTRSQIVDTVAAAGFAGILVNRAGYGDKAGEVCQDLEQLLGPARCSADGRWAFFDLAPYMLRIRQGYTAAGSRDHSFIGCQLERAPEPDAPARTLAHASGSRLRSYFRTIHSEE
jgi:hypothetical protein